MIGDHYKLARTIINFKRDDQGRLTRESLDRLADTVKEMMTPEQWQAYMKLREEYQDMANKEQHKPKPVKGKGKGKPVRKGAKS